MKSTWIGGLALSCGLAWTGPLAAAPAKPARPAPESARKGGTAPVVVKPGYAVTLGPAPSWVQATPLPAGKTSEAAPMFYRLVDEQIRLDGTQSAEHVRLVRVVSDAAGLGEAAQFELTYDPSHESVQLHELTVIRQGQRLPRLDRQRIELLQRETRLEQRLYDGQVTISLVLDDVRVGDELDFSFTRSGQNPVFGGRFVRTDWLASYRGPTLLHRTQLLAPDARRIQQVVGPLQAQVSQASRPGWRETVITRQDVAQLRAEPDAPASAYRDSFLQWSEFRDWAEVARWGETLFREVAVDAPRTAAKAAEIRAAQPTPEARVLEALRFVQQEVRYFGVEMGPGSHKPNPPDQVLQQRFGDCKDKVTLLGALLRGLDVRSEPVLVSTRLRQRVGEWQASPLAFDHVILRVHLDGQSLDLDPTRAHQTGPLAARAVRGMGQGLVLAADTTGLVDLPSAMGTERMRVDDRYQVGPFDRAVALESRITYRDELAEMFREALATQGLAAVSQSIGGPYVRAFPGLRRQGETEALNATDDNTLTLVQRFELPRFWRFPEERNLVAELALWGPAEMLVPPKMEARRLAYNLPFPGVTRHTASVEFAEEVVRQSSQRSQDDSDPHFRLQTRTQIEPRRLVASAQSQVLRDQVAASDWSTFTAALAKALPRLASTVSVSAIPLARQESLRAELRQLEEDLRRGRVKASTSTQAEARFKVAVLSAQLAGGRLAEPLKAQALVARGIAHDHSGDTSAGQADFALALALDPQSIEALNGAATNARGRGDLDRAIAWASEALAQNPAQAEALGTRALAHYTAGRWAPAAADWSRLLEDRSQIGRGYPLLQLALTARRQGQDPGALVSRYPTSEWPRDWPRPLLDLVIQGGDVQALLKQAQAQKSPLEAETEALYYVGELAAAQGDLSQARQHWQRAVSLGVVEFVEYASAQQRLKQPR